MRREGDCYSSLSQKVVDRVGVKPGRRRDQKGGGTHPHVVTEFGPVLPTWPWPRHGSHGISLQESLSLPCVGPAERNAAGQWKPLHFSSQGGQILQQPRPFPRYGVISGMRPCAFAQLACPSPRTPSPTPGRPPGFCTKGFHVDSIAYLPVRVRRWSLPPRHSPHLSDSTGGERALLRTPGGRRGAPLLLLSLPPTPASTPLPAQSLRQSPSAPVLACTWHATPCRDGEEHESSGDFTPRLVLTAPSAHLGLGSSLSSSRKCPAFRRSRGVHGFRFSFIL